MKMILKKIYAWGIWERLAMVVCVIGCVIGIIFLAMLWIAKKFLQVISWFLLNAIDLILIIPLFVVWIFTGKNLMFRLESWINEKTGFFEDLYA